MQRNRGNAFARCLWLLVAWACTGLAPLRAAEPAQSSDASEVVLREYVQDLAQAEHRTPDAALVRKARAELRLREAMARHARALGLQRQPDVQARLVLVEQTVLIQALLADHARNHPVTEAQLLARYKQYLRSYGQYEYHLAQITTPSEADAREVVRKLREGASFDALVPQYANKGRGWQAGSLGWVRQAQIAPPFDTVVATLRVGGFNEVPVRNAFGWHVVELQGVRLAQPPALKDVRNQLASEIQLEDMQNFESKMLRESDANNP